MPFDPLVTNAGRLRILTALAVEERQEFVHLRRRTQLTDGNLAAHAKRLQSAGLIEIDKQFREGKPVTSYLLTGDGRRALTEARRAEILATNDALAGEALRTLGVAGRVLPPEMAGATGSHDDRLEQEMVFAGLIGMIDPPRAEAAEAVAKAKAAGIRPMMITGDHPVTAKVIAAELGVDTRARF